MQQSFHAFSHPNRPERRARNEDALLVAGEVHQGQLSYGGEIPAKRHHLFAISDGLHITPTAARASHTLLTLLQNTWQSDAEMAPSAKVRRLGSRYCGEVSDHPRWEGMACTLVAAEIRGTEVVVYHVGDSRAWLIHDGRATRLTRDHTVLERLVREGEIRADESARHASIYDGLDNYFVASPFEEPPECDIAHVTLEQNDRLLLASDGVSMLTPDILLECMADKLEETIVSLFDRAVSAGSDDNISMILLGCAPDATSRRD